MSLNVIGAGFGRTGTHSLAEALEVLGVGPCYTIHEVQRNPGHGRLWAAALDGDPPDWEELFQSYQAAVEWPVVYFFPQLLDGFPQAKVILTLRDPESWYRSAAATIFPGLDAGRHNPNPRRARRGALMRRLILEETFHNRFREKDNAIRVYLEHIEQVRRLTPPGRLLEFDVLEGWPKLAAFLNRPIPEAPFPHRNDRASMLASAPDWYKELVRKNQGG